MQKLVFFCLGGDPIARKGEEEQEKRVFYQVDALIPDVLWYEFPLL